MTKGEASAGQIECPKCSSPMVEKRAPFYLHGEYVGSFESIVCEFCNFSLLTAPGYVKAMAEARKFGLVGPEEDMIIESITEGEFTYVLDEKIAASNTDGTKQVFSYPGEQKESEAQSSFGKLPQGAVYTKRLPRTVTKILAFAKQE